jgi:flavin-dependent dehydrogenase
MWRAWHDRGVQDHAGEANAGDAIVIGAGMAGLTAARVLADRFARVTIVDRDRLPPGPESRRGVPQSAHPHALLAVGRTALEKLFPGLTDELVDRGARWIDVARDAIVWQMDGYRLRIDSGVSMLCLSRPLLESSVRRRLEALPQVVIRADTAVAGLAGRSGERVSGVEVAGGERLPADLVVDASGRGNRSDRWLSGLGFPAPPESVITVRVHYTTQLVRGQPDNLPGAGIIIIADTPPERRRYGAVFPIEGDRWLVTLGGFHGEEAPTDPQGFQRFAESLPQPAIADLLRRVERLADAVVYTYPTSRRRHFERLRRIPGGYLAIGDALCSFNPVYGHGITVAAQEALMLANCLDRHRSTGPAMVRDYYRRTGDLISVAWDMAASTDFAFPGTEGPKPRGLALTHWYQQRVFRATHVSPEVVKAVVRVQHLITPGSALLRPAMFAKVLRAARRAGLRT